MAEEQEGHRSASELLADWRAAGRDAVAARAAARIAAMALEAATAAEAAATEVEAAARAALESVESARTLAAKARSAATGSKHWIAIRGYTGLWDGTNGPTVKYSDSAGWNGSSWQPGNYTTGAKTMWKVTQALYGKAVW